MDTPTHRAVRIDRFGDADVMRVVNVEVPEPAAGQVGVRHTAIGLNMIDTYFRSGLYPLELPSGLGSEAAGVVTAVGHGVSDLRVGDRVAYASPAPLDAYSEQRVVDARWLVPVPGHIRDDIAAATMLKGMTAWFLLHRSYRIERGDYALLHAAAGGVGLLTAQWAASLGARVIGVVGSEAKRALALAHGCEHVLLAGDDLVAQVRRLTGEQGVAVVYDSVGRDTFLQSLDCLRPHGVMVSFGNSSGAVEPFSPLELARRGSLFLTRPMLFDFIADRAALLAASQALFERIAAGTVRVEIGQRYPLERAADAHRDLAARRTTGSSVLMP